MRLYTHKGFSLLEALLAGMLFIITMAGAFGTLAALREPMSTSQSEAVAAAYGQQILDELRAKVDAGGYNDNDSDLSLTPEGTPSHTRTTTIDRVVYVAIYRVTEDPDTKARRVDLKVDFGGISQP